VIHEVAEGRDGDRWVLVEADAPAGDAFATGGDARQRCRSGRADPGEFAGAGRGAGMPASARRSSRTLDG
jgi:hypothetical protein